MHLLAYIVFTSASKEIYSRMGCVNSRTDINNLHPNIFQVMNVDDLGNLITPGRLEVTESDIILCQRSKPPIKWPLKCLRRYGYDAEIFSFESGRRCSTGPGIYAFKCRRAAQLFNLVQTNIQLVFTNGDDNISREMSLSAHFGPTATRVTIPAESNYLDPIAVRNNGRINSTFSYNQQNGIGQFSSIGSSSGPMSPQETMGSPSPPPTLPLSMPPPPPTAHLHPSSLYINDEVLHSNILSDVEHNNNKTLARRSMQRSHTISSSTSSSGLLSLEQVSGQEVSNEVSTAHNRFVVPLQSNIPSYMNVDLGNDASPLSPSHSTSEIFISQKEELGETVDSFNSCGPTYINVSPAQEKIEALASMMNVRPPTLSISQLQSDSEDGIKHCYANLEANEIESLKKRFSANSITEKLYLQSQVSPPLINNAIGIREVSYAVLDLDKKDALSANATTVVPTAITTGSITAGTALATIELLAIPQLSPSLSPPDSPVKSQQIGYVTIDFNKTVALSHSANSTLINDIDEGSRRTRHNSTISEFIAPSTRRNSSMSE